MGFLYGWSFFSVIQTGTIAAVGVAFSKFAGYFFPILDMQPQNAICHIATISIYPAQLVAIAIIILLTYTNTLGVNGGKWIQNIFTSTKLIALFGLIICGFCAANSSIFSQNFSSNFTMHHLAQTPIPSTIEPIIGIAAIAVIAGSMSGSIFSSDAWNNVTFIAGEIKNPQRNIGLSLLLGTSLVTLIYLLCNIMYLSVLPIQQIAYAPSGRVAVAAANAIFGSAGTYTIAALIMVSTFGCNNGLILAGARVYYTMALDGLFFKKAGTLNKNQVPAYALWIQCVVACLLCLSGKYGDLLDMVSFVVVVFYILTIVGVFRLRKLQPNANRPYKAFGFPILPIIYIVLATIFCIGLIYAKPYYAIGGLVITLLGIPIFYTTKNVQKS
jgi:APA family basic amino acid/polyamine antiporter